jgi:hypothetical protein
MIMMKIKPTQKRLVAIAVLLIAAAPMAMAQNIYKCVKNGQVAFTDQPCPDAKGELLHKADDADVIDQYLRLGQDKLAKQYAETRHLEGLYKQRVAAHQQDLDEKADREADEQIAAQKRQEQQQQQAMADAAANRQHLRNENDALRQQNDAYRDQLSTPVYNEAPAYWNGPPAYGYDGHRDRDHDDYDPRPHRLHPDEPQAPIFHPCTQLAGGRVKC